MKLNKSQTGIAHLGLVILIVLALGGVGFAGWKVYNTNKSKTAQPSTAEHNHEDATHESGAIPEGFVEYKNEEYGFSFAYPKEWGKAIFYDEHNDLTGSDEGYQGYFDYIDGTEEGHIVINLFSDDGYSNRDFPLLFTKGYKLDNGKVYSFYNKAIIEKATVYETQSHGLSYAQVASKDLSSYPDSGEDTSVFIGINLTKNSRYKGLQLYTATPSEDFFLKILETFQVTN